MINLDRTELGKVTYIKVPDDENRPVPLFPCYYGENNWEFWIPQDKKLIKIKPKLMVEGKYFSKQPESESDLFLSSIDFLCQRAYWKNTYYFINSLADDLLNLGCSLKKIEVFHNLATDNFRGVSRFVITEMEYIFSTCRSLFDLLQEIIYRLWDSIHLLDINTKKKILPQSFRKMVLSDNNILSSMEIQNKYLIPQELSDLYYNSSKFFVWMKDFRDNISHNGKSFEIVYHLTNGFAIPINIIPFSEVDIWESANSQPNNLGSVKSFLGYLINTTLINIDSFISFFEIHTMFPEKISPDYNVYIKGDYVSELINISKNIKDNPWY
jgi:hypothetical protein